MKGLTFFSGRQDKAHQKIDKLQHQRSQEDEGLNAGPRRLAERKAAGARSEAGPRGLQPAVRAQLRGGAPPSRPAKRGMAATDRTGGRAADTDSLGGQVKEFRI